MRLMTEELMSKSWVWLEQQSEDLNGFKDGVEFYEEWRKLGEVDGDGSLSFFTRICSSGPFEPQNVRLVNVRERGDFELVLKPCVKGGWDYE